MDKQPIKDVVDIVPKRKKEYRKYKPAKSTDAQIEYLEKHKNVIFNNISKKEAQEILLRYNYINVVSPFKHHFAKRTVGNEVLKVNGHHVYESKVDFSKYYNLYNKERSSYTKITENIYLFETHFKALLAYHTLNRICINDSNDLNDYFVTLELNLEDLSSRYDKRKPHMKKHIHNMMKLQSTYADVYCFFDRISLGQCVTIYQCSHHHIQDDIFADLVRYNQSLGTNNVVVFLKRFFTLVSIRNCIMHSNSLEILLRFYDPKHHSLRKSRDRKKYMHLIDYLSMDIDKKVNNKEKTHPY